MRVLTVRQPWAIIHGGKDVENRTQSLGPYRGLVAIHAGLEYVKGTPAGEALKVAHGSETSTEIHFGAVIGVVDLTGSHDSRACEWEVQDLALNNPRPLVTWWCSPWAMSDHHHLELANPRTLARPIPARGQLSLWRPDDALAAAIRDQLGGAL